MSDFKKMIVAVVVFCLFGLVYWATKLVKRFVKKKTKKDVAEDVHIQQKVRVAFISQNAILLCPGMVENAGGNYTDIPFETVLKRDETVEHGLSRMMTSVFGENVPDARFCLKYSLNADGVVSENYLFIVYCSDGRIPAGMGGMHKLWTRRQIEDNLGKSFFSPQFEEEYPHLRLVVDTWEMFA